MNQSISDFVHETWRQNLTQEDKIRLKIFDIFRKQVEEWAKSGSAWKKGYKSFGDADILFLLTSQEWNRLHSKWKRYLTKQKIQRSKVNSVPENSHAHYFILNNPYCSWRNLAGFYSITDPLNSRTLDPFVLDIPRDLGDKILVLNSIP